MSPGKTAAQCSHAAVACYKKAMKDYPAGVRAWEYTGTAKVTVKFSGTTMEDINLEMKSIIEDCKRRGVAYYMVEDAGRTQIAAGSRTVVGVGPAPCEIVDLITGHLKLM